MRSAYFTKFGPLLPIQFQVLPGVLANRGKLIWDLAFEIENVLPESYEFVGGFGFGNIGPRFRHFDGHDPGFRDSGLAFVPATNRQVAWQNSAVSGQAVKSTSRRRGQGKAPQAMSAT